MFRSETKLNTRLSEVWILFLSAAFLALTSTRAAGDAAALRARALEFFAPLPATMPGAEKDTPALVKLGGKLFVDKRLSVNHTTACNTCHELNRGGTYREAAAPGAFGQLSERNSPTVFNAGFQFAQFWDGRAATLEAQAREPMRNTNEMAMPTEAELLGRLRGNAFYRRGFARAFPGDAQPFTGRHVVQAIAAFERTLVTHDRFDDFLRGDDRALSRAERRGLEIFLNTGCQQCHRGPGLGGNALEKIGVRHPFANTNDLGRARLTGADGDRYRFKVPMLRNVVLTPPYFHDGSADSLTEAVRQMAWLQLDQALSCEEAEAIETFLHSLSDKRLALQHTEFLPSAQP